MNANKWKTRALILQIIGGILFLCHSRHIIFAFIGVPIFMFGAILEIVKWRCPYCKKSFFGKGKIIYKCPYCDSDIEKIL